MPTYSKFEDTPDGWTSWETFDFAAAKEQGVIAAGTPVMVDRRPSQRNPKHRFVSEKTWPLAQVHDVAFIAFRDGDPAIDAVRAWRQAMGR